MKVKDEVCGMIIESETAAETLEFQGTVYYFCVDACRRKFEKNPGWYVFLKDNQRDNTANGE